jgi:hypothetical protein
MREWLAVAAALPLFAATAAHAQMKGLMPAEVAGVARDRALDLRLSQQHGYDRPLPLVRGIIAQQDVADNAFVGVGLANMYGRKKGGLRLDDPPVLSRKPAVTFVVKF